MTDSYSSQRARMVDVANAAGVSTATVGRVIHNNGYVSDATRQRVERAIAKTGFKLNLVAQSLRKQRTQVIGHILTSLIPNPFFAGVELGVEEVALAHGYNVVIWNAMGSPQREREGVQAFLQRQVEAIIFTTPCDSANVQYARDASRPVVQVERPSSVDSHKVLIDNYSGSCAAVRHLLALGHRCVGYLCYTPSSRRPSVEHQRYTGYVDTLVAANIQPQEAWQIHGLDVYCIEDGYRGAKQLMQKSPDITAILVFSDMLAAGVLHALSDLGLRVPDDISVIGFDNTYAPYLTPPLTTVAMPMLDVGKMAAQIVIDALDDPSNTPQFIVRELSTELVVRQSTAPPVRR